VPHGGKPKIPLACAVRRPAKPYSSAYPSDGEWNHSIYTYGRPLSTVAAEPPQKMRFCISPIKIQAQEHTDLSLDPHSGDSESNDDRDEYPLFGCRISSASFRLRRTSEHVHLPAGSARVQTGRGPASTTYGEEEGEARMRRGRCGGRGAFQPVIERYMSQNDRR